MLEEKKEVHCNAYEVLNILKPKWTTDILVQILANNIHFGTLLRSLPNINPRSLAIRLRFLEENGILVRKQQEANPPQFTYQLTQKGENLRPIFTAMNTWFEENA
ncbi:helix-turn-helix domain-containing protein [uncultured Leuconostoc sp.]|uniref:winged helix-turn-helix transcriptional regulator n=1 Tax=uncultured Leuconostoc sp. TaxID=173262 RepID=UPI0025CF267C|nr:helix-turn-helix domain-containing protein [uncultured Leuconostoc sp.]